jgi:hypothetical protein
MFVILVFLLFLLKYKFPVMRITLKSHKIVGAFNHLSIFINDRLCGLVVRVLGYRSGGPG